MRNGDVSTILPSRGNGKMPSLQELDKGGEPKETHTSTSETAPPEKMDLPQDSWFDKLIIHTTGGHYYSPLTKGTGEPSGLATDHKEDSKVFCVWSIESHGQAPVYKVSFEYKPCSHFEPTMSLPDEYAKIITDAFSEKISAHIASANRRCENGIPHTSGSAFTQGLSIEELKELCKDEADTFLSKKGITCADVRAHQGETSTCYTVPVRVPTDPGDRKENASPDDPSAIAYSPSSSGSATVASRSFWRRMMGLKGSRLGDEEN
jgi:hypothetical protein